MGSKGSTGSRLRFHQILLNPTNGLHQNPAVSHVRPLLPRPQVFAHRGGSALRPENTILAFDYGLALGADGIEFDVHLSRDGVVVVHHDATLERTTNGRGALAARTAAELAKLDAGYNFVGADARDNGSSSLPYRGRAGGVPTLRDVLRRYPSASAIVELKVYRPELAHRVIDDIR